MDSLCHPWFTTTNLSYRFPIFETSATALRGTTGTCMDMLRIVLICYDVTIFWFTLGQTEYNLMILNGINSVASSCGIQFYSRSSSDSCFVAAKSCGKGRGREKTIWSLRLPCSFDQPNYAVVVIHFAICGGWTCKGCTFWSCWLKLSILTQGL